MPMHIQNQGVDESREKRGMQVISKGGQKMLKKVELNREEIITALEMAIAFILPIWGGMYLVAKVFG